MSQTKTIKPYEAYGTEPDGTIVTTATAVQTALTGNSNYSNLPVDLATLKTDIATLSALMAEARDGSKKVIAEKAKQREVVVKELRLLGRYVEVTCKDDMAIFQSSGFRPASTSRTKSPALTQYIRSINHGAHSGQIVIRLVAVPKAVSYELHYAAESNNGAAPAWTTLTLTGVRTPVTLSGLTPGTAYAFQTRSLAKAGGYTDWSDPVTFMCT
ncbi:MAG TPA: fibronectin type III domain-containing protein [Terriglobia bacterium]|jgi:hypothetical protein